MRWHRHRRLLGAGLIAAAVGCTTVQAGFAAVATVARPTVFKGSLCGVAANGDAMVANGRQVYVISAGVRTKQSGLPACGPLSADGSATALITWKAVGRSQVASSTVYRRTGAVWSVSARLAGAVAAFSADGREVAVVGPAEFGAVATYRRGNAGWYLAGRVTGNAGTGFGTPVQLSDDAKTMVVGDPGAGAAPGALYIYRAAGNRWVQAAVVHDPTSTFTSNGFGVEPELCGDGRTLIVQSGQPGPSRAPHKIWIWRRTSGGRWVLSGQISGSTRIDVLGASTDGTKALIAVGGGMFFGGKITAAIYAHRNGRWTRVVNLSGPGPSGRWFGPGGAMSGAGNVAALTGGGANTSQVDIFSTGLT